MLNMSGQHYCRINSIICQHCSRTISAQLKERSDTLVYKNVLKLATQRGMSISELERKAGLSKATIPKWKTSSPTVDNLKAVATVLKVKVDKLLE